MKLIRLVQHSGANECPSSPRTVNSRNLNADCGTPRASGRPTQKEYMYYSVKCACGQKRGMLMAAAVMTRIAKSTLPDGNVLLSIRVTYKQYVTWSG